MSFNNLMDKNMTTIKKVSIIILSFIFFLGLGAAMQTDKIYSAKKSSVIINGVRVYVDIADTLAKQTLGLSGRNALKDSEGMIFVFDKETIPGFWMKDMNFPIDIIWIDSSNHIVSITKRVLPSSYPKVFTPIVPIKYVLEVSAGFADRNNVKNGDETLLNL